MFFGGIILQNIVIFHLVDMIDNKFELPVSPYYLILTH